ncbi:MAG: hypothetical protein QOE28_2560, partial [Solirubrobacteraceae bacterium]|nr:hypothetical protein [Solirubrobacteraceae bacterium]
ARAGGPRPCAAAAKLQRPSPVHTQRRPSRKPHARITSHRRARVASGRCLARYKAQLIGTLGATVVAGAPSAFSAGSPFVPVSGPAAPVGAAPAASAIPAATPAPTPTPGENLPVIPTNPRAIQVQAFEFGLLLSKGTVLNGDVRVEFNSVRAEDPHNLVAIRADGTGAPVQFDEQPSGAVTARTVKLTPGKWTLFCSLPGHQAAGMQATLTVQ